MYFHPQGIPKMEQIKLSHYGATVFISVAIFGKRFHWGIGPIFVEL